MHNDRPKAAAVAAAAGCLGDGVMGVKTTRCGRGYTIALSGILRAIPAFRSGVDRNTLQTEIDTPCGRRNQVISNI